MTVAPPTPLVRPNPVRRGDLVWLALVLVVAAALRLGDLGRQTEYGYDQATLSSLALDVARGRALPLTGIQSSAGVPNSPVTAYLLAVPYLFTDDPQVVVVAIAAFNVLGVGLLWWLAYRYFNPLVAHLAALAYALHPHAIHYSRSIWAQDFHTPILLAALLLALLGFWERRRWAQLAALPVFVVGAQVHYAAWTLLPVLLWIGWTGRRPVAWPAVAGGVALAVLTLVPFALGLAAGSAAGAVPANLGVQLDSLLLRDKAALYAVRLATGLGGPWVGVPLVGFYDAVVTLPGPFAPLWLLVGGLVVVGLVTIWRAWGRARAVLLALWAALPFLAFLPNWTGVYPHYFVPTLPALSLAAALGAAWLMGRFAPRSAARPAIAGAVALVLATQGIQYALYVAETETYSPDRPDEGTPVHFLMDVRAALAPYRDVLISGGTTGTSGAPIWRSLLDGRADCVRELVIADGGVAVFPDHPFAVLVPPGALAPAAGDLYASGGRAVPLRPGEGAYTVHEFQRAPAWDGPSLAPVDGARWANDVALTGYRLDAARAYLRWTLPAARAQSYQVFLHFLDANGEKLGQRDTAFWPSGYWCAGDTVVTWVDTDVPAGTHTLRVGLYTLAEGAARNVDAVDASGSPVAPWVDIPLE